jgi:hypothetical protein
MDVINGLPAHVLLVHAIVVLAPLTALLEVLCGVLPSARRRLVWLVLGLAIITAALTPLTVEAGEWFYNQLPQHTDVLNEHANRGQWMIYFSGALVVVALAQMWLHVTERKAQTRRAAANVIVAVLALGVGISTMVTVYRIGDSGSQAVWHGVIPAGKR